MESFADERLKFKKSSLQCSVLSLLLLVQGEWLLQRGGLTSLIGDCLLHACMDPIDLIFYRERASQPAKNETKEK